ncbi:MAG TPA: transglycosylase domain-containing protein [Solirubrobacteraceae bacterium]|jgi:penicillin-binding protein 1A|nr:transglycosylase domain-containing protein [Solirubrobacteraceae bacterium]
MKRRSARRGHGGRIVALSFGVVAVGIGIAALSAVAYVLTIAADAPNIDSLKPVDKGAVTQVFAADGKRLGFIDSTDLRTPIADSQIPKVAKQATVAIEDQRFYHHGGIDPEGIVRAAFRNIGSGKTLQGGSTITQQLVRNLYISPERTFARKIKEAKLAEELESKHSKRWILDTYLNSVSYGTVGGQSAVGLQAASRLFFDRPASRLTLAQAALLAGLPQAPSRYNPFLEPTLARARRNDVLHEMIKQRLVPATVGVKAMQQRLGVKPNSYYTAKRENYFFDYVKQELIDRYGANTVRKGGLKVYTTVDIGLQKAARKAIAGQLYQPGDPSSAIVTIDPRTGYIRAMASSGKYGKNKFNYAAQGHRQPGSTAKVWVLMTALRRGVDPDSTTYNSHPLDLNTPFGPWKVQTYSHSYGGDLSLTQATLQSDNTVYAQLDLDLGPKEVRKTAYDLGIRTHLNAFPAEGLGGLKIGVSPLEQTNAYATIASGGIRHRPIAVRKVVFPDGHTDNIGKPRGVRVFKDGTTYKATQILQKNIQSGTGTAADIGCPAGGKTGTTDSFSDAWFVGFTPRLTTGVWVGYPNQRISMTSVHGIEVAGGTFPARIWHDYMQTAKGSYCGDFPKPSTPFQSAPFFGKYASTGGNGQDFSGNGSNGGGSAQGFETNGNGGGGSGSTGGSGGKYNKRFYASPPQGPPNVGGH